MTMITPMRRALAGIRRHPLRAAAVCVPLVTASVLGGTTMAAAHPEPSLAVAVGQRHAAPAPHVLLYDNRLGATAANVRTRSLKVGWNVDGCDHDYGAADVCVPWRIPGSTAQDKCTWLRSKGFGELEVYGKNRQDLPENAEGDICP